MQKVERIGLVQEVAVLYSPSFGAGWSTWNKDYDQETLCMDADIVNAVLEGDNKKAIKIAKKKCPEMYDGGGEDLEVKWIPKGEAFFIKEYDGSESIILISELEHLVA
jgi:hypothetical protein